MENSTLTIKKHAEIWTKDGQRLGEATHVYHRLEDVNPAELHYAAYLEIFSFEIGEHYFIPTDFIAGYDAANGRLTLSSSRKTIEDRTWHRMPGFIAMGKARKEDLPA